MKHRATAVLGLSSTQEYGCNAEVNTSTESCVQTGRERSSGGEQTAGTHKGVRLS